MTAIGQILTQCALTKTLFPAGILLLGPCLYTLSHHKRRSSHRPLFVFLATPSLDSCFCSLFGKPTKALPEENFTANLKNEIVWDPLSFFFNLKNPPPFYPLLVLLSLRSRGGLEKIEMAWQRWREGRYVRAFLAGVLREIIEATVIREIPAMSSRFRLPILI